MRAAQVLRLPASESSMQMEIETLKIQLKKVHSTLAELKRSQVQPARTIISVFISGSYRQVDVREIIMIRAMNNYSTIYLDSGDQLFTSRTLKYWEGQCNSLDLVRIHSSFLIHKFKIKSIQTETSTIQLQNGLDAQYARMSKMALHKLLGSEPVGQQKNTLSPVLARLPGSQP